MTLLPQFTYPTRAVSLVSLAMSTLMLTACQSLPVTKAATTPIPKPTTTATQTMVAQTSAVQPATAKDPVTTISPQASAQFIINGKIGVTTPKQAGSAFYIWTQQGQNFAIELAGALNAAQTKVSYNGQLATLTNDKGTLHATTPEELLQRATGWQVPISQLPYWVQGQSAPSDTDAQKDTANRLVTAQNGDWHAEFSYAKPSDTLPSRLTARHPDGYKVVMTINRLD